MLIKFNEIFKLNVESEFIKNHNLIFHLKYRFEIFQNESSNPGIDFIVKTKSGNYHEVFLQPLNLDADRSVKIPKTEFGFELKDNLWIALVLFMKEMEPAIYLIPSKVFENPSEIFINNEQDERFRHLSNWEVKVFTKAIPELSKYGFSAMVTKLS